MALLLLADIIAVLILSWLLVADITAAIRYRHINLIWHGFGWFLLLTDRLLDIYIYGWTGFSLTIAIVAFTWIIIWTRKIFPELSHQGVNVLDVLLFRTR
jgi:hypothetical protein